MSKRRRRTKEDDFRSEQKLIQAAVQVFADKGFEGASLKEISENAGVNIALISYYFQGKEGLFRTCIESLGKKELEMAQSLLVSPQTQEEVKIRLELFIDQIFRSYSKHPEVTQLIHREFERGSQDIEDIFQKTYYKVFETLVEFLNSSRKSGFLKKDMDPKMTAVFLFGCLVNLTRMNPCHERLLGFSIHQPTTRKRVTQRLLNTFLEGVLQTA